MRGTSPCRARRTWWQATRTASFPVTSSIFWGACGHLTGTKSGGSLPGPPIDPASPGRSRQSISVVAASCKAERRAQALLHRMAGLDQDMSVASAEELKRSLGHVAHDCVSDSVGSPACWPRWLPPICASACAPGRSPRRSPSSRWACWPARTGLPSRCRCWCSPRSAVPLNLPAFRRARLSAPLLAIYRKITPNLSETEQIALEAGTVGFEGAAVQRQAGLVRIARPGQSRTERRRTGLSRRAGRGTLRA